MLKLNKWINHIQSLECTNETKSALISQIKAQCASGVPIILDYEHLALLLGVKKWYLGSVIYATENNYKRYRLKKKAGGFRDISVPNKPLKAVQRWILRNILDVQEIHKGAHGFVKDRSIVTNAALHLGSHTVLSMDLKDFFPSISYKYVIKIFISMGYSSDVAFCLSRICTYEGVLPQGAPTSPALSNIAAMSMDEALGAYAAKRGIVYTRYADDISFSGVFNEDIKCHYKEISRIVERNLFRINKKKTRLYQNTNKCVVTGINIAGDRLRVPKRLKREVRSVVYHIRTKGYFSHIEKLRIRDPMYLKRIQGRIEFIQMVEGRNVLSEEAKTIKGLLQYFNVE